MASEASLQVAKDVIEKVSKGKIPNKLEIQKKHGYSLSSARAYKGVRTKTYQRAIIPVVASLEIERRRAIEMLPKRIKKAKYRDLVDGIDKFTKNLQLLTGGATSNIALSVRKLSDDELEHIANGSEKGISE